MYGDGQKKEKWKKTREAFTGGKASRPGRGIYTSWYGMHGSKRRAAAGIRAGNGRASGAKERTHAGPETRMNKDFRYGRQSIFC